MLVFEERGKLEYLEKTSQSRVENQQTQPTNDGGGRESNLGHIGGRRVLLLPLRQPCSANPDHDDDYLPLSLYWFFTRPLWTVCLLLLLPGAGHFLCQQ